MTIVIATVITTILMPFKAKQVPVSHSFQRAEPLII